MAPMFRNLLALKDKKFCIGEALLEYSGPCHLLRFGPPVSLTLPVDEGPFRFKDFPDFSMGCFRKERSSRPSFGRPSSTAAIFSASS